MRGEYTTVYVYCFIFYEIKNDVDHVVFPGKSVAASGQDRHVDHGMDTDNKKFNTMSGK